MKYWDIIDEIIEEIDNKSLRIYVEKYDYEEGNILVFDSWKDQEQFNLLLEEKMKDIPEIKEEIENTPTTDDFFVEEATGGSWCFSDEGFLCSECYKWHYYNNDGAYYYANYFIMNGCIICEDCLEEIEDYQEEYIQERLNNPDLANTMLDLKKFGFEKINNYCFESGYYGQTDNPRKILEKALDLYPECEFVFEVRKDFNAFEISFDLYRREAC